MQSLPHNILIDQLQMRAAADTVLVSAGSIVTARQLLADIGDAAAGFLSMRIDRLGLLAANSSAWITADLACQSASICLLPLPTFFSDSQISHSAQRVGINAVLTDDPARIEKIFGVQAYAASMQPVAGLTLVCVCDPLAPRLPDGTQKITFTSGSTGTPKGVCLGIDHQMRVATALDQALQIPAPRHLCLLPLSTLLENVGGVYFALLAGGTVFTPPDTDTGFSGSTGLDMPRMLETISRHRPTTLILIPQMLVGLVAALEEGWQPPKELQFAAVGGAKVAAGLIRRARELGLPVYEGYGLSESGSVACLNTPGKDRIGSVGRPLSHVQVEPRSGTLCISGNTFFGYLDDPDSWNRESVDTGDIGEIDDVGFVYLQGRSKNVLISSFGRNISPEWVESEFLYHPEVSQCVVFGDSKPYCVALISAAAGVSYTELNAIIQQVNESLPDYARICKWHRLSSLLSQAEGFYTQNGRPRRAVIEQCFGAEIDGMYSDKPFITPNNKSTPIKEIIRMKFFDRLQSETQESREYLFAAPIIDSSTNGKMSLHEYVAYLCQAYHHVKHTVPLLMAAGSRVPQTHEWLRDAIAEYIDEEHGHQEWILNDIEACGYEREAARNTSPTLATELLVAYAYDTIARVNPVGFFGMVHVLEGTSIVVADRAAEGIQRSLGLPDKAFSYLRSHGALDQEHVTFFEQLMNRIADPEEQDLIIHCAKVFYRLFGDVLWNVSADQVAELPTINMGANDAA